MPIFSSKFGFKKSTPRKLNNKWSCVKDSDPDIIEREYGLNVGPIKIQLGNQDLLFENGEWIPETGPVSGTHKENRKLTKYVKQLEEENNLLKLKCEILLDMAAETTAEFHMLEQLQAKTPEVQKRTPSKRLST